MADRRELFRNGNAEREQTAETGRDRLVCLVCGPGNDPERWRAELERIILGHSDYRGRLLSGREYGCRLAIAQYLEGSLPRVLADGQAVDAAKLVLTVYAAAFSRNTAGGGDGLPLVLRACREALAQILSRADGRQERKIFYLLHEGLEDRGRDRTLEELILSLDWSPELRQKNLQWLEEEGDHRQTELLGTSDAALIAWWEQRRDSDSAYHPLLQLYEVHDLPKAIALVRERRDRAGNTNWQCMEYTKALLRLLEKAGAQAEQDAELRFLVAKLRCREPEYLSRLKQRMPPERWRELFAQLIADAGSPVARMGLYHFEGMYPELLAELCRDPSFSDFLSYEQELRAWDPEQTLRCYGELLKREMDQATQRKHYRCLIRHLDALRSYPDGECAARDLAAHWHRHYKNRPAMRDELQKAGYP